MKWFGNKIPTSLLGIDIGTSGVKIVELAAEHGRARLLTYGFSERVAMPDGQSLLQDPKRAAQLIRSVMKSSGVGGRRAIAALPVSNVFSSVIAIPEPETQEAGRPVIEAQARKLIPLPFEDMALSVTYIDPVKSQSVLKKELGKNTQKKEATDLEGIKELTELEASKKSSISSGVTSVRDQKNVRVLMSAAPKSLVAAYAEIAKQSELNLVALDVESFGLIRSLIGKDRSTILLVDMGAVRTNLTVVEAGIPFFTRSVHVGGSQFTQAMAETMGVSLEKAEQMKFDLAMSPNGGMALPFMDRVFGQLVNEIRYVFEQYKRQEWSDHKRVEKIILTGGSAAVPGVKEFLVKATNLNTYIGDPWARVAVPQDLRLLLDTVGPSLSIAIGLAMRDSEVS